jgi:hypothetical protein
MKGETRETPTCVFSAGLVANALDKTRSLAPVEGNVWGIGRQQDIGRRGFTMDGAHGACGLVLPNNLGLDGARVNAEAVEHGAHPLGYLNVIFAVREEYMSWSDDFWLGKGPDVELVHAQHAIYG